MRRISKTLWYVILTAAALSASTILISYGWLDNGVSVISIAGRLVGVGTAARTGNTAAQQQLSVWGGNAEVGDPATLGSESLTNGALTSGTSWTQTGDFALTGNAAVYTHSTGVGTIVQASGTLAVAGVANRWYKFVYTVSAVTTGMTQCSMTSTFADTTFGTAFDITAGVAKVFYFKSKTSPGNFVISCTSTAGGMTLDDLSLKEVQGGNAIVYGLVTGGGTTGLKVASNGSVSAPNTAGALISLQNGAFLKPCVVIIGDPGAASAVLANDNDSPVACGNSWGSDWTILSVACWADAGSPTVTPILTAGSATSVLSGALTCGTAAWAPGTVNGSPAVHTFSADGSTCAATPCTIDANITTAGGTAKYIVIRIVGTL